MFEIRRIDQYKSPTILDLYKIRDQFDFAPYYQRYSEIWSIEKKRLLIDTIINGYDIPKFYIHYLIIDKESLNDSGKKFAIIDGKQRLQTIFEFLEDGFKLDESVKSLAYPDITLSGANYSKISGERFFLPIKYLIENYSLDFLHIVTDENERIEEMFLRLNEGMPVNNAEKRNAIGGLLIDRINKIVKSHRFFLEKLRFGNKRMEHQDLLTKLCLLENYGSLESFTKKNLDALVKNFNPKKNKKTPEDRLRLEANELLGRVMDIINDFNNMFNPKDTLLRSKGTIPLYFWYYRERKPNVTNFKKFIAKFESIRETNRRKIDPKKANATLLEFDRLNQQGAHQRISLEKRLKIFDFYFDKFKTNPSYNFKDEIPRRDLGLKEYEDAEID